MHLSFLRFNSRWPLLFGCLAATCVLLWQRPLAAVPLALAALMLLWLSLHRLVAGLAVLLALLPVLDFAPWSGERLVSEWDVLFVVWLAAALFRRLPTAAVARPYEALFWILGGLWLLSTLRGFVLGQAADDVWQSQWNSVRVGKGFLAAWLTWWCVRGAVEQQRQACLNTLGLGCLVGLGLCGLSVLWERHVFQRLLYGHNRYAVLESVLDFSGSYRITGWFSGMHVGGTAIDGYLLCAVPLAFYAVTQRHSTGCWWAALSVLGLGLYGVVVTFTRTTLVSAAVALALAAMLALGQQWRLAQRNLLSMLILLLGLLLVMAGGVLAYRLGGYQGLAVLVLTGLLMLVGGYQRLSWLTLAGLAVVILASVYGVWDALRDSRWHQPPPVLQAFRQALGLVAVWAGVGWAGGGWLKRHHQPLRCARLPLVCVAMALALAIGVQSTQMTTRLGQLRQDWHSRTLHWQTVIATRTPDSFVSTWLGEGMGSMARRYYGLLFSQRSLPSFAWSDAEGVTQLLLGANGFPFQQRVALSPHTDYHLIMVIRSDAPTVNVSIAFCHKHLLFSERWQPDCVEQSIHSQRAGWQTVEWSFNSQALGQYGWADWPVTLQLHNYGQHAVAIDRLSLTDAQGREWLRNGDFNQRLQHWFWSSDFDHLPWHSKQLWLHLWLENGWLGVLAFAALWLLGVRRQWRLYQAGDSLPIALLPVLIAVLGLGCTDTFIDEAPISFYVLLLLLAALQWPAQPPQAVTAGS